MADFLQKYNLVNGQDQPIDADASIIAFDFTNDSPFDVDIKWGNNKPVAATIPPTTIWRGLKPSADLLISGNKRNGTIIATPSYPGGGSPPSGAPAMQLTVHGYVKGNEPPESLGTLNRLQNIGNSTPLTVTATQVLDTTDPAGTEFIKATVSGVDHFGGFTDGFLRLQKDATSSDVNLMAFIDLAAGGHNWEIFLKTGVTHALYFQDLTSGNTSLLLLASGGIQTDGGKIVTDGTGIITSSKAQGGTNQYPLQMKPSDQATFQWGWGVSSTGNALISDLNSGTIAFTLASGAAGGLKLTNKGNFVQAWSFFSGNASGNYNHGLGTTPNVVLLNASAVGSETLGWDTPTGTQVHITNGDGVAWTALALLMA